MDFFFLIIHVETRKSGELAKCQGAALLTGRTSRGKLQLRPTADQNSGKGIVTNPKGRGVLVVSPIMLRTFSSG